MVEAFPNVIDDVSQAIRTNCMGFASFTLLVWDHIDTFADEVEYIWKGRKGPIVYLFLLNRYLTPLGFIVNLFAYLSPVWTQESLGEDLNRGSHRCRHFVRFEGAMTVIGLGVAGLMMLLRINALYYRQKWVAGIVALLQLFEVCVISWLVGRGIPVLHNPRSGIRACTMIFDTEIIALATAAGWSPFLHDTVVLGLTLYRTIPSIRNRHASYVMKRLLADGVIYYSAIFLVELTLTIMIFAAPPGLKNLLAQLGLLLIVAMMSRITLNLKKSVTKDRHEEQNQQRREAVDQSIQESFASPDSSLRFSPINQPAPDDFELAVTAPKSHPYSAPPMPMEVAWRLSANRPEAGA
ncbi:putative expressed protein [Lyophyllum shimeji]|uniref:Expressed protein n=1 Tax=Lyophyllum shimeji TaxID=47721 RepID=A0A9P3PR60_LYOSH|nr:putative expressed protein [Lyophyllum shimeji]